MRALLLSDIHGNLEALQACLAAAPAHDLAINLGDIVGYGASPNEVTKISRELSKFLVRGNHDKAAAGLIDLKDFNPLAGLAALWTRNQLTPENLEWLAGLAHGPVQIEELPGVQFVHGSPRDEDEYVITPHDALASLLVAPQPVTFFGHTHLQGCFASSGFNSEIYYPGYETVGQAETAEFELKPDVRYMVNPGSVGQPRDNDWRAAFAFYDSDKRTVTFHRVPYNLKDAQERIIAANLPPRLATRLAVGR